MNFVVISELVFGKVFWDYSNIPFNLGGRINLLYCFFWGIAAGTWMRYGYPLVAKCMGKLKSRIRPWMTAALAVFMAAAVPAHGTCGRCRWHRPRTSRRP